jgi:hypothetical protein
LIIPIFYFKKDFYQRILFINSCELKKKYYLCINI